MIPDEVRKILVPLVIRFEGLRLKAYRDIGGIWTIGYGHTGPEVVEGLVWSAGQAQVALEADASRHYAGLLSVSPTVQRLSASRQAALSDFVYNLGVENYTHSLLRSAVDVGAWENVKIQLLRWDHDHGKVIPGLLLRRQAECNLIDA